MALWVCLGCSAAYAVGLPGCPQCRGTEYYEEGTMPKISKAHGPTDGSPDPARVVADESAVEATEAEAALATDPAPETEAPTTPTTVDGGEQDGAGPEQGQDGATDGATEPDGEGAGDEPAVAPKAATRRRTARG